MEMKIEVEPWVWGLLEVIRDVTQCETVDRAVAMLVVNDATWRLQAARDSASTGSGSAYVGSGVRRAAKR